MARLPLRGPDVLHICGYLDSGGAVAPASFLALEGKSFVDLFDRGPGNWA